MKYSLFFILLLFSITAYRPKPAYQIFTGDKAKPVDFEKMMKGLQDADVVFFGENHNNSMCHWLQLQVLKSLADATGKNIIVGAEMFEADDQLILNEYLNGMIKEEHLKNEAKVWDNYETDYAPLVEYARENELPFIATNIPRRYANLVARSGLDALEKLDVAAKDYIVDLPIEVDQNLSTYQELAAMMGGHMVHGGMITENMINSQAIKDATMAHFIRQNITDGSVFFHINGSFHTKNKEGIIYYLHKSNPELEIVSINVVDQDEITELQEENSGLADYVIAIPSDMTKTY